jgi:DNA-binding NarL/FixJ family response regulator
MELTFDTLTSRSADAVRADVHGALVERLQLTVRQIIEAELARAIEAVPRAVAPAPAAAMLSAAAAGGAALTLREREVLQRMAAGDSNKLIAR